MNKYDKAFEQCLSKGLLKQGFLEIYLTRSFGVRDFRKT